MKDIKGFGTANVAAKKVNLLITDHHISPPEKEILQIFIIPKSDKVENLEDLDFITCHKDMLKEVLSSKFIKDIENVELTLKD